MAGAATAQVHEDQLEEGEVADVSEGLAPTPGGGTDTQATGA